MWKNGHGLFLSSYSPGDSEANCRKPPLALQVLGLTLETKHILIWVRCITTLSYHSNNNAWYRYKYKTGMAKGKA
jgi:hypothetical protein